MKCKICEKDFELKKENKYLVSEEATGLQKAFGTGVDKIYEAFDCPHCGCQNLVNERIENVIVARSRFADCKCDAIQTEWEDGEGEKIVGSHDGIVGLDVEESVEEKEEDLPYEYDYDAMTKEQLVNLCKEKKIAVGKSKEGKQYYIDKLIEHDKFMESWGVEDEL